MPQLRTLTLKTLLCDARIRCPLTLRSLTLEDRTPDDYITGLSTVILTQTMPAIERLVLRKYEMDQPALDSCTNLKYLEMEACTVNEFDLIVWKTKHQNAIVVKN
jgi:hypothetical protein